MHLNTVTLIGRISKTGPQLRYSENGTPVCSLVIEVDEFGPGGKVYTTYLPIRISGKLAEQTSVEFEARDIIQVTGKLKYESSVDKHTSQKVSKMVVSTWGIAQRHPAHTETSGSAEPGEPSDASAVPVGQLGASGVKKPRKRPYPAEALRGGFQN